MRILYTSDTLLLLLLLLLLLPTTTTTVVVAVAVAVVVVVVVVVVVAVAVAVVVIAVKGHLHSACPTGDEELKERVVIPERRTNLCETEFQQLRCDK